MTREEKRAYDQKRYAANPEKYKEKSNKWKAARALKYFPETDYERYSWGEAYFAPSF